MLPVLEYFASEVPAGTAGAWVIEKVTLPPHTSPVVEDRRPEPFHFRPGTYTCLRRGPTHYMTDLYDEWYTQRAGIAEALQRGGEVLITGLGLGLVAEAMLRPPESAVTRVTIVELSADVIALTAPYLQARYPGRLEIVQGDAFTWNPPVGRHFSVGWHDIWPDPYPATNTAEMAYLKERYRPWCGWQGFWPREYLQAVAT